MRQVLLVDLANAVVYKIKVSMIEESLELFQINVKHIIFSRKHLSSYCLIVTGIVMSHVCVSNHAITSLLMYDSTSSQKRSKTSLGRLGLLCLLAGYRERKGQTSQR